MPLVSRYVLERFPQHASLIEKLARDSDEFRSLCEDYALVVETLDRLKTQPNPSNGKHVAEYSTYLLELEFDIVDALTTATM